MKAKRQFNNLSTIETRCDLICQNITIGGFHSLKFVCDQDFERSLQSILYIEIQQHIDYCHMIN